MSKVKSLLFSLFGLMVALIALMVLLRLFSKVPVIGGLAEDATNLIKDGSIQG